MTAEIAIMNKSGIALAADSMMSNRAGSWPGARKLFALSDSRPVAVMVYNSARFMTDLWGENIVPAFKDRHRNQDFPTIDAWTDAFAKFVTSYRPHQPADAAINLCSFVTSVLTEVEDAAAIAIAPSGFLHTFGYEEALELTVDQFLNAEDEEARVLSGAHVQQIEMWGSIIIRGVLEERAWLDGNARLKRKVRKLITARLGGATPSTNHSGIVIAGYGAEQHTPALCGLEIEGYLGPYLKMRVACHKDMAQERSAQIAPFAQRDMVDAFISGMDESLKKIIRDTLYLEALDMMSELATSKEELDRCDGLSNSLMTSFMAKLDTYCRDAYTKKVMSLVDFMPPHELPGFAQALVRASVMRHRYSIDQPSVGDPIDVALISKARQTVDLRLNTKQEDDWRLAS